MTAEKDDGCCSEEQDEQTEPYICTAIRAIIIGLAYVMCILAFAITLMFFEEPREENVSILKMEVRNKLRRELASHMKNSSMSQRFEEYDERPDVTAIMDALTKLCAKPSGLPTASTWSFKAGLLLSTSIITTTGYGQVYPTHATSQIFCIVYACIGIPLVMLLLHKIKLMLLGLYYSLPWKQTKLVGLLVLPIGVLGSIFIPAVILMYAENWNFWSSIYYSFMSVTTIGLGKGMAGIQPFPNVTSNPHLQALAGFLYHSFLIVWLFIGIGYLTLLIKCIPIVERYLSTRLRMKYLQMMKKYYKLHEDK